MAKATKKYRKNWGKLYQVRMSKDEYKSFIEFVKRFNVTNREFLISVQKELSNAQVLKNGEFFQSDRDYVYKYGTYKQNPKDACELCNDRYRYLSSDPQIIGHHFAGYDDENMNNVKWLCRRCHGFAHRGINKNKDWEEIIEQHKNWNGKTTEEEMINNFKKQYDKTRISV